MDSVEKMLVESFRRKLSETNISTGDISKILQFAYEDYALQSVKSLGYSCEFAVSPDGNGLPYDLLLGNFVKIQVKGRARIKGKGIKRPDLHLENTRRKSNKSSSKNAGSASSSGHVKYRVDEFDIILFIVPGWNPEDLSWKEPSSDHFKNTNSWKILAIPSKELEDPKTPGFLKSPSAKLQDKWISKNLKEVLDIVIAMKGTT